MVTLKTNMNGVKMLLEIIKLASCKAVCSRLMVLNMWHVVTLNTAHDFPRQNKTSF